MIKKLMLALVMLPLLFSMASSAVSINPKTVFWTPPTTNVDGTPLTDLTGYKVYVSKTSGNYAGVVGKDVGLTATPTAPNVQVASLALTDGIYFVVITAYDKAGLESTFSNEGNFQLAHPSPPSGVGVQ